MFLSAPPQARERGFHYRRHPTDAQAEAAGDTRHATAASDDQVPAGARTGHQGQHLVHRQGKVHAHAQGLPQHSPPGGLYLLWGLRRPLRQPCPLCQPRPLRQVLWWRLSTLWRPRPLRGIRSLRGIRHLRWFRPLWKLFGLCWLCVLFLPRLLLCAGLLNGITLEKAEKENKRVIFSLSYLHENVKLQNRSKVNLFELVPGADGSVGGPEKGLLKGRAWSPGASSGMLEASFLPPLLSSIPVSVLPLLTI